MKLLFKLSAVKINETMNFSCKVAYLPHLESSREKSFIVIGKKAAIVKDKRDKQEAWPREGNIFFATLITKNIFRKYSIHSLYIYRLIIIWQWRVCLTGDIGREAFHLPKVFYIKYAVNHDKCKVYHIHVLRV